MSLRPERKIRKQLELLRDDVEWYNKTHLVDPDDGYKTGLSPLLAMLLHSYREVCENPEQYDLKGISPIDITTKAAQLARSEIEGEEEIRSNREGTEEV